MVIKLGLHFFCNCTSINILNSICILQHGDFMNQLNAINKTAIHMNFFQYNYCTINVTNNVHQYFLNCNYKFYYQTVLTFEFLRCNDLFLLADFIRALEILSVFDSTSTFLLIRLLRIIL